MGLLAEIHAAREALTEQHTHAAEMERTIARLVARVDELQQLVNALAQETAAKDAAIRELTAGRCWLTPKGMNE